MAHIVSIAAARNVRRTSRPDLTGIVAQHRAETERAIAAVRYDTSLDDRERARRITEIVAQANGRTLTLSSS